MLLKIYYSLFPAVTPFPFNNWLRVDLLINRTCIQLQSIKKKGRHGNCRAKVHSEKYSAWYMKRIRTLQCEFADAKINWLRGWHCSHLCEQQHFCKNLEACLECSPISMIDPFCENSQLLKTRKSSLIVARLGSKYACGMRSPKLLLLVLLFSCLFIFFNRSSTHVCCWIWALKIII